MPRPTTCAHLGPRERHAERSVEALSWPGLCRAPRAPHLSPYLPCSFPGWEEALKYPRLLEACGLNHPPGLATRAPDTCCLGTLGTFSGLRSTLSAGRCTGQGSPLPAGIPPASHQAPSWKDLADTLPVLRAMSLRPGPDTLCPWERHPYARSLRPWPRTLSTPLRFNMVQAGASALVALQGLSAVAWAVFPSTAHRHIQLQPETALSGIQL